MSFTQRDTSSTGASEGVADPDAKILLREETEAIIRRVETLLKGGGKSSVIVANYWQGELRWARNRASLTSDRRDTQVFIFREIRGGRGSAMTNQIDDASLAGVVRSAERQARKRADQRMSDQPLDPAVLSAMNTTTWSDATLVRTIEQSATFVQQVTEDVERNNLLSAGYLETRGQAIGYVLIDEYGRKDPFYGQLTQAQCSVTVRHPKGTSSGWAGLSNYDISKIDEKALAKRALDKCMASLDPVRIEPGRYTVILEPQAVADLVDLLAGGLTGAMYRRPAENRFDGSPFFMGHDASLMRNRSKLGQRVIDERITIGHDPSDPELGVLPIPGVKPVTWIENGVLQALHYDRSYALNELNENEGVEPRGGYRMSGGTTSMDEMIATTKRGLIVTRLPSAQIIDESTLLASGVTRDGLWLVENGKITKAVRNFRFTESPLFALNNVVELGVPVPVFHPFDAPQYAYGGPAHALAQVIVPPLKVNDFSFTSTIDAV